MNYGNKTKETNERENETSNQSESRNEILSPVEEQGLASNNPWKVAIIVILNAFNLFQRC